MTMDVCPEMTLDNGKRSATEKDTCADIIQTLSKLEGNSKSLDGDLSVYANDSYTHIIHIMEKTGV